MVSASVKLLFKRLWLLFIPLVSLHQYRIWDCERSKRLSCYFKNMFVRFVQKKDYISQLHCLRWHHHAINSLTKIPLCTKSSQIADCWYVIKFNGGVIACGFLGLSEVVVYWKQGTHCIGQVQSITSARCSHYRLEIEILIEILSGNTVCHCQCWEEKWAGGMVFINHTPKCQ